MRIPVSAQDQRREQKMMYSISGNFFIMCACMSVLSSQPPCCSASCLDFGHFLETADLRRLQGQTPSTDFLGRDAHGGGWTTDGGANVQRRRGPASRTGQTRQDYSWSYRRRSETNRLTPSRTTRSGGQASGADVSGARRSQCAALARAGGKL